MLDSPHCFYVVVRPYCCSKFVSHPVVFLLVHFSVIIRLDLINESAYIHFCICIISLKRAVLNHLISHAFSYNFFFCIDKQERRMNPELLRMWS